MQQYQAMDYAEAPESRSEADAWLKARDLSKSLFVNGEWKAAASGATFDVLEPASGKLIGKVSEAGKSDVDLAVAAARKALPKWQAARRWNMV